jgi:urease accessory protein
MTTRLIHALRFTDSFFPVGAFAYSDGLETATASGIVHDGDSLAEWMNHYLESIFVSCDGPALAKSMHALRQNDLLALHQIDEELTAIRPSAATRAASIGIGKRLLSLYSATCGDAGFAELRRILPHGNAAAAYGLVFFHCGLNERDALTAFGYNRLAGIVSAGLRLIQIGHQEGQMLLTKTLRRLPDAVDHVVQTLDEPLRSFSPLVDIQQMNHQYLYSRLFRS